MACISFGGFGATIGTSALGGASTAPGRDFIDLQFPISQTGSLDKFDVYMDQAQPVGATLKLKVWRLNGANYDFIGQSQTFSNLANGLNTGLLLHNGIAVVSGDFISIQLSESLTNVIRVGQPAGVGTDFKVGDPITNQAVSSYANIPNVGLSVALFGDCPIRVQGVLTPVNSAIGISL